MGSRRSVKNMANPRSPLNSPTRPDSSSSLRSVAEVSILPISDCSTTIAALVVVTGGAGAALIIQSTDLEEARQAVDLGADVIVAAAVPAVTRTSEAALRRADDS